MPTHSIETWLSYITSLSSDIIHFNLKHIRQTAEKLNLRQWKVPVITVTGTNGKGTTATMLEKIYLFAGYRTGLFQSPFLFEYTEQIRINGISIDEPSLCQALTKINQARSSLPLTVFEFTTLAALLLFRDNAPDIIILEVGMGGLHDAVNIVSPTLSIITNVEMDHMKWLGGTRESIALEKFGIVRPHRSVIYADLKPLPNSVIDQIRFKKSKLYSANQEYQYAVHNGCLYFQHALTHIEMSISPFVSPQLTAAACMAVTLLHTQLPVGRTDLATGISNTRLPGRFQVIQNPVIQVFDAAHNPASAAFLYQQLQQQGKYKKNYAVFSMLREKDITGTIQPMKRLIDGWYISTLPHTRGAAFTQLSVAFNKENIYSYRLFPTIEQAYHAALRQANKADRIIVFGSFVTVAAILALKHQLNA
jgi:dihydrofolate synthase/folylpolyglutamate synthase